MELTNKAVGRNLAKFRMLRDMKAFDLAEKIGMKEAAYTMYERGESKITIELLQKIASALNVDPIQILTTSPDNFIETLTINSPSPGAGIGNEGNKLEIQGDYNAVDKQQQELMVKLMEKLIDLLGKK